MNVVYRHRNCRRRSNLTDLMTSTNISLIIDLFINKIDEVLRSHGVKFTLFTVIYFFVSDKL